MTDAQPPQAETRKKSVLNRPMNGTVRKVVWWIMGIISATFLLMAALLGNTVLEAVAAQTRMFEAHAERLRIVETKVATIEDSRFTSSDGMALEIRLMERIAATVIRIEAKIDLLRSNGG